MWNMNIEFNPEHVQPFSLNSELREKDRERKTQNKWKNKTKHDSEETNNSRKVQKESGEAWPSHLDQIQHSQVQLRWESRVRLRHDSLTPNLEILIFSFPTEGKKLYLWEAFRQNRERCGRICFCQRGGCSTTCFFFFPPIYISTQSQRKVPGRYTLRKVAAEVQHNFHEYDACHVTNEFWQIAVWLRLGQLY